MGAISLRLPDDLACKLATEADLAGRPRSEVIRDALAQFIAQRERARFMAELAAEARVGYGDPQLRCEALDMAEEAVALGNEVLDLPQRRQPGEPWPEEVGEKWWK